MSSYVGAELRRLVEARASHRCEYCGIHREDAYFGCEVDHIISEKHGGATEAGNLAYACAWCNWLKGTDLGSIAPKSGVLVRFYHPRTDQWADHFRLSGATIVPLTEIGEVTASILGLNRDDRREERAILQAMGRYPREPDASPETPS
jgi:hypothetical protein